MLLEIISSPVFAYVMADQQVTLDFPVINTVESKPLNTSAAINSDNGNLSNSLSTYFDISTNNYSGVVAEFTAQVDTNSGTVDGMTNDRCCYNKGKIVLTNIDSLPTNEAVYNALSPNPFKAKNNNVIAYSINFIKEKGRRENRVYFSSDSNTAKGNVIRHPGSTRIKVSVDNNPHFLSNTFDKANDNAGTYQATIYCTVYSP